MRPPSPIRCLLLAAFLFLAAAPAHAVQSIARQWDEMLLGAIRRDVPAPTVHSRNLFHLSAAMFDAWTAYAAGGHGYFVDEKHTAADVEAARAKAISFAAYRILQYRYTAPKASANASNYVAADVGAFMDSLGYDKNFTATEGDVDPPAELGNRIAATIIEIGLADGSNEGLVAPFYSDPSYTALNPPMVPVDNGTPAAPVIPPVPLPGVLPDDDADSTNPLPELPAPNYWQPISLTFSVAQNGLILPGGPQKFIGSKWRDVTPFAVTRSSPDAPYADQGLPPLLNVPAILDVVNPPAGYCPPEADPPIVDDGIKDEVVDLIRKSSQLDPNDPATIDISPGALGNNPLGTNDGTGYAVNPATGLPYAPNVVKFADFGRVLAEFWADGPASETPPGHWNTIANYVSDHPSVAKRIGGVGPLLGDLEWDVKLYFSLNGALYDAAISAWSHKRIYDSVRPITLIRYMGGKGQSSDPLGAHYCHVGLPLVPGLIELVTAESSAPGERHEFVLNANFEPAIGEIAIYAWPGQPTDPETEFSGARWIRAVNWLPYQRSTFVTPAFPGFTSGHSTFSRAAAELLTRFTGDAYFPGGLGTFTAPQDTFLAFEVGPTQTVELQWARYYDAADQAGISRLLGGIHIRADDFGGRRAGSEVGAAAWEKAQTYFAPEPAAVLAQVAACGALALLSRRRRDARGRARSPSE